MRAREFLIEKTLSPGDFYRENRVKELIARLKDNGKPFIVDKTKEPITLRDNTLAKKLEDEFLSLFNSEDFQISAGDAKKYAKKFIPKVINGVKLSTLFKEPSFGGETSGHRTQGETGQIDIISRQLEQIKQEQQLPFIKLKVGDALVDAATVVKTFGVPKSDMTILGPDGNATAWVSLKAGTKFRWGGWSAYKEDPDIKCWLIAIEKYIKGNTFNRGDSFGLTFDNINKVLQNKIIFGSGYGGEFGENNVNIALIDVPKIKFINGNYVLTGTRVYENGNPPTDEYAPYLVLRYVNDRNDVGFNYARAEANPKSEKRKVKWIEPICTDSSTDTTTTGTVSKNVSAPAKPAKIKTVPAKIKTTPAKQKPTSTEPIIPVGSDLTTDSDFTK